MKNPMTPAGIEPATFRFVAQHLNHCATAVPSFFLREYNFYLRPLFLEYKKGVKQGLSVLCYYVVKGLWNARTNSKCVLLSDSVSVN